MCTLLFLSFRFQRFVVETTAGPGTYRLLFPCVRPSDNYRCMKLPGLQQHWVLFCSPDWAFWSGQHDERGKREANSGDAWMIRVKALSGRL